MVSIVPINEYNTIVNHLLESLFISENSELKYDLTTNDSVMRIQISTKNKLIRSGPTQLRCFQPADYLRSQGAVISLNQLHKSIPEPGDVLLLHRAELDNFTDRYIKYARKLGLVLIYDTDDLLFSESSTEYLRKIDRDRLSRNINLSRAAMSLCDAILVSTEYLAKYARTFHDDVRVMRNALSRDYFEHANSVYEIRNLKEDHVITMSYMSGSLTHNYDFKLVEESLLQLLNDYSHVHLKLVGPINFSKDFYSFGTRFKHLDFVDYRNFPTLYKDVDINLIPLEVEQEFCQSKSELKYIEAGACGVPSVASPTEVYLDVIKDKVNGVIVAGNNWYESLQPLIENPHMISELGGKARKHTLENYSPEVRANDYIAEFGDIMKKYGQKCKNNADQEALYKDKLSLEIARLSWYARKKIKKYL